MFDQGSSSYALSSSSAHQCVSDSTDFLHDLGGWPSIDVPIQRGCGAGIDRMFMERLLVPVWSARWALLGHAKAEGLPRGDSDLKSVGCFAGLEFPGKWENFPPNGKGGERSRCCPVRRANQLAKYHVPG